MEESIWGYVIMIVIGFIGLVYQELKELNGDNN